MKPYLSSLVLILVGTLSLRAEEKKSLLPPDKEFTNSLGMKFVRLPAGSFIMGNGTAAPKSRDEWQLRDHDESPAHAVRISRPFFMGSHEVTNAQYEQFAPDHQKFRGQDNVSKADDEPVTFVTYQQANAFCTWLSKKEGRPYRLPTEAEWEYACRAGTTTKYHTGDTLTPAQANLGLSPEGKPQRTVRVGSYPANPWGLYDMHGNVAEWCRDWYGPYEAGEQVDPVGRAGGYARVTRGWSFFIPARQKDSLRYGRSANRAGLLPNDANRCTGFRIVLGDWPETKPLPVVLAPHQKNVRQGPAPTRGPDAAKPYFVNYTKLGKNPTIAKDAWGPTFINHNHYAAVCVCPNGDVLACWYSTVTESGRELLQAGSRLRVGSDRWEPASLFFDVPDINDHAPVLFCDGKRIYHFCTQSLVGWDNSSNIMRFSDDNGVTWSQPQIILSRDAPNHLSQPCTAFLGKDNVLVLACDGDVHKDERIMTSADGGKTWRVGKGDMRATVGKYAIHPAIAPLDDGSIIAYLRGPHPMPAVVSKDGGDSWQLRPTPFPGISSGMKPVALRLAGGGLLLCSIDRTKELVGGGTFAALSHDNGQTWAHVRPVEGVGGYMAVAQAPNGIIYLFGTRMGCVAFNEAWLKEGRPVGKKGQG